MTGRLASSWFRVGRRQAGLLLVLILSWFPLSLSAEAEEVFPARPIVLVVPVQAGTASDLVARVLANRVGARLGQPIVVENTAGAGGALGAQRVATAEPSGYTIGAFNNGIHTVLPFMGGQLPFDPMKDFVPLTLLANFPLVLIANPALPVSALQEFVALARQHPGKINYASPGPGSPQHIGMERLMAEAGIQMTHVPYRGGAQATQAIATGEVDVFWIATSVALPFIQAGKVRALAVGERQRTATLPDVPTVQEAGYPDYEFSGWLALFAPRGTPAKITERLRSEFIAALQDPEIEQRIKSQGVGIRTSTGDELMKEIIHEREKTSPIISRLGLKRQ